MKQANAQAEIAIQASSPNRPPLPLDLRKWQHTAAETLPYPQVFSRPSQSIDLLITQFTLWDTLLQNEPAALESYLAAAHRLLTPGGIWYLQDLLPLDAPAHWLYQAFPDLWAALKLRALTFHSLFRRLQHAGFNLLETKRRVYQQTVGARAAYNIAQRDNSGLLTHLHTYPQACKTLKIGQRPSSPKSPWLKSGRKKRSTPPKRRHPQNEPIL